MSSHHCWLRQCFHERVKGPFRFEKQTVVSPSLLKDCQLIFIKINVTHCRPFSKVPFLIDLKALGMKIPKFVCYDKIANVPVATYLLLILKTSFVSPFPFRIDRFFFAEDKRRMSTSCKWRHHFCCPNRVGGELRN